MLSVLGMILFWLVLLAGIAVIPFGIAGTFIIVGDTLVYGLLTQFSKFTIGFVGILLVISVLVEGAEFVLGAWAAKKYGSSSWGMWGAILGGFFGAIWFTPVAPPFSTLLGAFIGAFLGAFLLEVLHERNVQKALKVGWGAFLGAVSGKILKIVAAVGMIVAIGIQVF
ncbi:hypothetical protein BMS3Abin05_01696 [bacterium BMS3Abin05]|nr:hypothetical protein BMS3Abin05_01696 [bacterium BMS3Abin05]GBE28491.1 hypothetical protein BMS3Bbin03_02430 [bacterium BMS3Bbin03]